jgi:hypothetical protein
VCFLSWSKHPSIRISCSRNALGVLPVWRPICHGPTTFGWVSRSSRKQKLGASTSYGMCRLPSVFISAEPLLGPVHLDLAGIDWLIAGGESGAQPSARRSALDT